MYAMTAACFFLAHIVAWVRHRCRQAFGRVRGMRRRGEHAVNWRELAGDLAPLEWKLASMIAQGVDRVLGGERLDLNTIYCGPMPPGFAYAVPRSAEALTQRMEIIARILVEPERYIRRIAGRIARKAADPLRLAARSTSPTCVGEATAAALTALSCLHRLRRGRWIATSASRDGGGMPRAPPIHFAFATP
jgi:hypothetical protein